MRISDWSSDVCFSDLPAHQRIERGTIAGVDHREQRHRRYLRGISGGHRSFDRLDPCSPIGVEEPALEEDDAQIDHLLGFVRCPEAVRSEEHTSELQSLMRISYAVFCLKKKKNT